MTLDLQRLSAAVTAAAPDAGLPEHLPASISGVADLATAGPTDLCFSEHAEQAEAVAASAAIVLLVPMDFPDMPGKVLIRCGGARRAFFAVAALFVSPPAPPGVDPGAHVHASATLGEDVSIGPGAAIGVAAVIGARCVIAGGAQIGADVQIGDDCVLEPNVTVMRGSRIGRGCTLRAGAVIGSDGFGFAWDGERHRKVPQLGRVVLEDEVDIGCNSCVDRATLGETRVRRGTKVDNLVQIAHNTDIGEHVILVSQSGVAGSSRLGTGVVVAGQVAVSDHVTVGAGARIGGQSGVTKDVAAGATVFGTPARDMKQALRELGALAQLPELLRRVKRQERELAALRQHLTGSDPA